MFMWSVCPFVFAVAFWLSWILFILFICSRAFLVEGIVIFVLVGSSILTPYGIGICVADCVLFCGLCLFYLFTAVLLPR